MVDNSRTLFRAAPTGRGLKCGEAAEEMDVKIDVEYCGSCGHKKQFLQLAEEIKRNVPSATVAGTAGRQASFEVQVNDELVYSKLQTLAFPDFVAIADMIRDVSVGKPVRRVDQQQAADCVLL
ncbi:PREDICTED: migration and invasion enhancer 1 [Vollenhovia emeryi]|uniref:migration and invasion enhancer 1 n=1 Tax=Vollenhovia emeryi TaxID=411798 RepID=UPI0005F4451F|nr:PREDICTED: migration and invasion enhancer 1 [Vollenhovia emeryi]XP_011875728.1 PREDICTED: migration and invasion enhancer 1 [Vollenhovia emeryi]